MAKIAKATKWVGIKELKDSASSIIEEVQRRRRPITITKNNREVARIVPIEADDRRRLEDLGLILSMPRASWNTLELTPLRLDASKAIEAMTMDRDE